MKFGTCFAKGYENSTAVDTLTPNLLRKLINKSVLYEIDNEKKQSQQSNLLHI